MYEARIADQRLRSAQDALRQGQYGTATAALENDASAIAGECVSLIRDGLHDEAATRLERWLSPKFSSVGACREAYAKAMGGRS